VQNCSQRTPYFQGRPPHGGNSPARAGLSCPRRRGDGSFAASHFQGAAPQLRAGTRRGRRGRAEVCYGLTVYPGSLPSTGNPAPLRNKPPWQLRTLFFRRSTRWVEIFPCSERSCLRDAALLFPACKDPRQRQLLLRRGDESSWRHVAAPSPTGDLPCGFGSAISASPAAES